jgi:hypothetical protein
MDEQQPDAAEENRRLIASATPPSCSTSLG